ncbi:MAG TPA: two-component regulator propeller domain-containing protein, partial [Verrucomicrobiota bacterium]|nr:two-component regulator propeller domain-containing protein [Verrucomicrobiota bacterium]
MLTQVRRFTCSLCVRLLAAGFSIGVAGVTECGAETYLIDVKDTEHNLPSSIVTAITQTPDGYLWVGTYDGLSRFDGERFVNFHPINTPELSHARVQGLFVDATGTLWIATYRGGLTSYREGVFRQEWPDDETWFDLHTRLVFSSESVALFATQFGE